MSYKYETERSQLFAEDGQGFKDVITMFRAAEKMHYDSGAFTKGRLMHNAGISGDSFYLLAVIDMLIEIGVFQYVYQKGVSQEWVLRLAGR